MTRRRPHNIYNAATLCDVYKLGHRTMYPGSVDGKPGTTRVYSNMTARSSRLPGVDKVVFFGLQAFTSRVLEDMFGDWFAQPEDEVCAAYECRVTGLLGPNDIGVEHMRALHRLGYLPLRICAVPEGTEVPLRVPMYTVENTLPEFFWLTNYIESILSAETWLPITSATQALQFRRTLDRWAGTTSDAPDFVNWQGHDFSFRGMSSLDSAAASGAGHLLCFAGTDSIPALDWIEAYYPRDLTRRDDLLGGSVPATEHSVMCAGGELGERDTYLHLISQFPSGVISIVSDTWDYWHVLTETVPSLKDEIIARDGKVVIRPDSGDPVLVICGDPDAPLGSPEHAGTIELLWNTFGGLVNSKGYRELDPHIGAIYGDSITLERAERICAGLAAKGFASTNLVFGVGSFTYQFVTRDTFGQAMKATWAEVNGEGRDLFKDPKTDNGVKRSARGRLAVLRNDDGSLFLVEQATPEQEAKSLLQPVWQDGEPVVTHSWDAVVATIGVRTI
jgi:nicotinamide phosphoribosyltransferase